MINHIINTTFLTRENFMEEFQHQLHKLPDFLQKELAGQVGNTTGMAPSQVVARYRVSAEHLAASKLAVIAPQDLSDAKLYLGHMPHTKESIESQVAHQNAGMTWIGFTMNIYNAHIALESNRFLAEFAQRIAPVAGRLVEQEQLQAQHLAAEAARLQAQRVAEEAARIKAEEEARELAKRQIEEAKQAALALARSQVEEAARTLAARQAQSETAENPPQVATQSVAWVPGPEASQQIKLALSSLGASIEVAIMAFHEAMQPHADLSDDVHFDEILRMSQAAA
ncbi:hypothetical protein [Pseudomonas cichorii]|uniref:hypothetical protein n=1 Tax=Pseudomonas cichorii TaxID=36746 RepID=UPI0019108E20|nr:hypothetical protein [Pseudomonas cichorii]